MKKIFSNKNGTKGAVSVFLAIILVPCILLTSVFVDLGRVSLSKNISNSAAELALNSLLTNYDADLNEWYGMIASCQNIEDFYEVSAQTFLRIISSQNLSEEEILLLADYYSSLTNDDSIHDLLKMESLTGESDIVKPVKGANLTDPTIIQDQVVEFMKYRGPIVITTEIIDRFKNVATSEVMEGGENTEIVESKKEFYEAEGELLTASYHSYLAIKKYQDLNIKEADLKSYVEKFNNYKAAYETIHTEMVKNLTDTEGLTSFTHTTIGTDAYTSDDSYNEKSDSVHTDSVEEDDVVTYIVSPSRISELYSDLENKIEAFNNAINAINNDTTISELSAMTTGDGDGDNSPIRWWVKANGAISSYTANVSTAADEMMQAYARLKSAKDNCSVEGDDEAETPYWDITVSSDPENTQTNADICNSLLGDVEGLQSKYLSSEIASDDVYDTFCTKLESISNNSDYKARIDISTKVVNVDGTDYGYDGALSYIKGQMTDIYNKMTDASAKLDVAINGDGSKVKSLDDLADLAETYKTKLDDWESDANNTDTDMAGEHREDIGNIRATGNEDPSSSSANDVDQAALAEQLSDDAVNSLKTRLTNIKGQIDSIVTSLDSMTYGGASLKDIGNYATFKSKAGSLSVPMINSEISSYAQTQFTTLFKSNIATFSHEGDNNYNPDLEVAKPAVYQYLQDHFKEKEGAESEVEKAESDQKNAKKEAEKKKEEAKKGRAISTNNIKKDFSEGHEFGLLSDGLGGLVDNLGKLTSGNAGAILTDFRDNLYGLTYIMQNFSYATHDREGMNKLYWKANPSNTSLNLTTFENEYKTVKGNADATNEADNNGKWLSTDLKDTYNKSMTNKLINSTNNYAYLAEVEYIIYGKDTSMKNIGAAAGDIFGIRYALNLVSAFQNFWTMDPDSPTSYAINTIAGLVASATAGIIPAPVTKVVLLALLTAAETCCDLGRLNAGFKVELYKTDDQWWISFEGGASVSDCTSKASASSDSIGRHDKNEGIYYSDYLTLFLFMGLNSNDCKPDIYRRMMEVIQANLGNCITKNSDYSVKKSQVYFKLEAEMRVSPLMITLPIFDNYDFDMKTKKDWCTYKISTVRGYT